MEIESTESNNKGLIRIQDAVLQCRRYSSLPHISGILALDVIKQGWNAGELCIVGGRPAMGRTGFVLSLMANLSRANIPVALLSATDTLNERFVSRAISALANVETPVISADDAPFYVNLSPRMTLSFIRDNVKAMIEQKGIRFVFIETLQSIFDSESDGNTREGMEHVCHELRVMSREFNVPFIVTSNMNRNSEHREGYEGKAPQMSDLRASSAIEDVADSIILLFRPEYYGIYEDIDHHDLHGLAKVIIAKNKYGETGEVWLRFNKSSGTISDMDQSRMKSGR